MDVLPSITNVLSQSLVGVGSRVSPGTAFTLSPNISSETTSSTLDNSYGLPQFSAFQLFMQSHVQMISGHASPWECPRLETKSNLDSKVLPLFQFSEAICLYGHAPQLDLEQQSWTFPQEGAEPRQPQCFAAGLLLPRRRVDYPPSRFCLVHTYWDHRSRVPASKAKSPEELASERVTVKPEVWSHHKHTPHRATRSLL